MSKLVINTFKLKVDLVRLFKMDEVTETAVATVGDDTVVLVWEGDAVSTMQEQAERLWSGMIPARMVCSDAEEVGFVRELVSFAMSNN